MRIEVSSTNSTEQRRLRRRSATRADQTSTRAATACQCTPWRRAAALNVITFASATTRRDKRAVSAPSKAGCSSKNRLAQLLHTILRRDHTNRVRRPDTSRSRTFLARRSCTRWHLNPHCAQRSRLNVDSTLTTSAPGVSSTTSNTRICAKCSRTVITSQAIGALLDRGSLNHRFQQGLDPYSGTLNHPAPHIYAKAQELRSREKWSGVDTGSVVSAGRLANKACIVTGSAQGIGFEVARAIAREGGRVMLADIGTHLDGTGTDSTIVHAAAEEIRSEGGVCAAQASDVTDPAQTDAAHLWPPPCRDLAMWTCSSTSPGFFDAVRSLKRATRHGR